MTKSISVAVLVGSLRKESFTRRVATAMMAHAPKAMDCRFVEIGNLPHYNQDLDDKPPFEWESFRAEIKNSDAVLFFTPEYNRSFPGHLKNAIDIASRPHGRNLWDGMPAGVVSVTPYTSGGMGANHALRQTFIYLNMPTMQQPEAYISNAGDLVDAEGKVINEKTGKILAEYMSAFAKWVGTIRGVSSATLGPRP
jgi:NAD(P)H-dependent FMN reductase